MSTMWDALKAWKGQVIVDDAPVTADELVSFAKTRPTVSSIKLRATVQDSSERKTLRIESVPQAVYSITVKSYMTKKATPSFDFMAKWNNDIPMPLLTMVGTVEKETPGMVYMKLRGDITGTLTRTCMKCGKEITNPVSQYFGLGPVCGGHNYVNPFSNEDELREAVEKYRVEYLQKITWEGWIIKSAIIRQEEVKYETL